MNNQKSRRLKRKTIKRKTIKRKTIKRKQNKKLAYNQKKMYGGDFNPQQQKTLKKLLTKNKQLNFDDHELKDVMTKLNSISCRYEKPNFFEKLQTIINNSQNKIEFNNWLEEKCDQNNGETDDEDDCHDLDEFVNLDDEQYYLPG
jgi:hypothetical protein